ncbi:hypothetical protein [Microbulbifer sp. GL-2]|uniref:hypothetical protein n=1 Tax=Microbulbifer sp. GL-2 TaxID=2591606 RepID=UPI001164CBE3|nr:hypothetical protein [Microbulbifer sp. GL-2]BBM00430.1 hypothetical protein GL2_05040 [Microbulbifer sp. GL-2]
MYAVSSFIGWWKKRKNIERKSLSSLSSKWAVLIGVICFLVAAYFGWAIKSVLPEAIKVTNQAGWSWEALGFWIFAGIFGSVIWVFGCVAARCHTTLYDRWFL